MKPQRKQRSKKSVDSKQEFSCEICSKNFQHKGSYTDHLKTHANYDVKYECSECPCFFKNAGHLNVHVKEVHNNKPVIKVFKCKSCVKTFKNRQALTEHKKEYHPSQIVVFNCKFCKRPYSSKNSLKWHINLNHNEDFKRSKCPYCPCDFKWPHHLKVHIRKAHIEKGHAPSDLLKNGLTSIRRKTNNCVVCREKFEKKFDLMVHLKYVHKQELDIYKCCLCLAVFTLGNSLKLHLDEHRRNKTGYADHKCDQCFPVSSPKLYEGVEKVEKEIQDGRTDIEKEIIDFELSLMENEDIRELIKFRLRHAKRPKRKSKGKKNSDSDQDEICENGIQNGGQVNGKGKYYCERCKLSFQMRFSFVTHLKDHSDADSQTSNDENRIKNVEQINEVLEDAKVIENGVEVEHKNGMIDDEINSEFDKKSNSEEDSKMDREIRIQISRLTDQELQKNVNNYKCNVCNHAFPTQSALDLHVETHKEPILGKRKAANSRYQCPNCSEKFSNPLALSRHIRIERNLKIQKNKQIKDLKCKICKTTFAHRKLYLSHMKSKHSKNEPKASPVKSNVVPFSPRQLRKSEKIYECGKCEIFFTSKLELLRHISDVHMYIKPKITSPRAQDNS